MPGILQLSRNNCVLSEFTLDDGRLRIGRARDSDIRIDHLTVSARHAEIVTVLGDSFLHDLNSKAGTFVNGIFVKNHALNHGDIITIAKFELKYVNTEAIKRRDTEGAELLSAKNTAVCEAALQQVREVCDAQHGSLQNGQAPPPASIEVLRGPAAGKVLPIEREVLALGRPGAQLAAIVRTPYGYFVAPAEGDGELLLNGNLISSVAGPLENFDVLVVADAAFEFTTVPPEETGGTYTGLSSLAGLTLGTTHLGAESSVAETGRMALEEPEVCPTPVGANRSNGGSDRRDSESTQSIEQRLSALETQVARLLTLLESVQD